MKISTTPYHPLNKSLLLILLMAFNVVLLSCGSNTKEPSKGKTEETSEEVADSHGLSLNNGMKWKSDQATMANVNAMKLIMENSSPQSIEEFHMTADMMQGSVDKMISECRMTGADHDALHLWLEPLMEKTKELKEGETMDELTLIHDWLDDQVNLFYEYFEE
jgi:hypothetical protein